MPDDPLRPRSLLQHLVSALVAGLWLLFALVSALYWIPALLVDAVRARLAQRHNREQVQERQQEHGDPERRAARRRQDRDHEGDEREE